MKYKTFEIKPIYSIGSDCRQNKKGDFLTYLNGEIISKKPTYKDIEYYEIYDLSDIPDKYGNRGVFLKANSIKEAKIFINDFIDKLFIYLNDTKEKI